MSGYSCFCVFFLRLDQEKFIKSRVSSCIPSYALLLFNDLRHDLTAEHQFSLTKRKRRVSCLQLGQQLCVQLVDVLLPWKQSQDKVALLYSVLPRSRKDHGIEWG